MRLAQPHGTFSRKLAIAPRSFESYTTRRPARAMSMPCMVKPAFEDMEIQDGLSGAQVRAGLAIEPFHARCSDWGRASPP